MPHEPSSATPSETRASRTPTADHPVLELSYEVKATHRVRLDPAVYTDEFLDWFRIEQEEPLTAQAIHDLLVDTRHLPEMLLEFLLDAADAHTLMDAEVDDFDLDIAWVRRTDGAT